MSCGTTLSVLIDWGHGIGLVLSIRVRATTSGHLSCAELCQFLGHGLGGLKLARKELDQYGSDTLVMVHLEL